MRVASSRLRSNLMIACATALLLAGCDDKSGQKSATAANSNVNTQAAAASAPPPLAALPLAQGAAPSVKSAPAASALPAAPPVRYAAPREDRYAYLDRAYSVGETFGDAPPDYTYDYDDERPMVWRSDDGYQRVAEQLSDGGVRYYYYQPGAEQPYLVQDPDYSYGYSEGNLTVVYDDDGNILSDDRAARQMEIAARYLARARALYAASVRQQHEAVAEEYWNRQRERFYSDQQRWQQRQRQDTDWRSYRDAHRQQEDAHWAPERYRRAAEASRFAQSVNDATAAARATQALEDARAQARRAGEAVGPGPVANSPPPRNPRGDNRGPQPVSAAPNSPPPAIGVITPPNNPQSPDKRREAQPERTPLPPVAPTPSTNAPRRENLPSVVPSAPNGPSAKEHDSRRARGGAADYPGSGPAPTQSRSPGAARVQEVAPMPVVPPHNADEGRNRQNPNGANENGSNPPDRRGFGGRIGDTPDRTSRPPSASAAPAAAPVAPVGPPRPEVGRTAPAERGHGGEREQIHAPNAVAPAPVEAPKVAPPRAAPQTPVATPRPVEIPHPTQAAPPSPVPPNAERQPRAGERGHRADEPTPPRTQAAPTKPAAPLPAAAATTPQSGEPQRVHRPDRKDDDKKPPEKSPTNP